MLIKVRRSRKNINNQNAAREAARRIYATFPGGIVEKVEQNL